MIRPAWIASIATVLFAGSVFAVTTSAQATPAPAPAPTIIATATAAPLQAVRCDTPSTSSVGFQPYLTLVNQPTTFQRTTAYRNCNSIVPSLREGYETRTANILDDCTMILLPGVANFTIIWNTTQTTTFSANRTATVSGSTLTVNFSGTVTAGLFAGRNVRQIFTGSAIELNGCLSGAGVKVPFLISGVSLQIF